MTLEEIVDWLNRTYPTRDWDQECQRLMWNVVYVVSGTPEKDMHTPPTATAARLASSIESTDADAAPPGAMHWFKNPAAGHVALELGSGLVLMTGTEAALGVGGVLLGKNFGVTTVAAYSKAKGNPYLGWSRTNGKNASIIGKITTGSGSGGSKKVTAYRFQDTKARKEGRMLAPGGSFYLHTDPNAGTSNARNVVGGVGNYSITEHLYAEGTPGDVLRLVLRHQTNPGQSNETNSDHYQHDFVFDANGQIRGEAHAQPYVGSSAGSVAVYALLTALKSNKGTAKITVFDSVAYLHA